MRLSLCLLFIFCCFGASAQETCVLQAPLSTFVTARDTFPSDTNAIQALIVVPTSAPADLGVGAFIKDTDGNWFQLGSPQRLDPGTHNIHFSIDDTSPWQAEPNFDVWDPSHLRRVVAYGLFFWSAEENRSRISVRALRAVNKIFIQQQQQKYTFHHLRYENLQSDGHTHGTTGKRWSMQFTPTPMPNNPYARKDFQCDLLIESSSQTFKVPGFYLKPMRIIDSGDRDEAITNGAGYFECRFRPRQAGVYKMQLSGTWNKGQENEFTHVIPLPDFHVSGDPWDDYVRVDENDKRFLRTGINKELFWPIGINIHSVNDPRAEEWAHSKLTPDRTTQAYKTYIERFSRAGATSIEIWMSSWNTGLEWNKTWLGFHGVGDYNEGNAQRMDEILDHAYKYGMRLILVTNNHGQASDKTDHEWGTSPFNHQNGGPLEKAVDFFLDERAHDLQQDYRRYLVARYADHPAVFCWKLFSEMNLTSMGRYPNGKQHLKEWHSNAFDAWAKLDIYDHLLTSHWSGDYRQPDRELLALPNIDLINCNAYHQRWKRNDNRLGANIIYNTNFHPSLGFSPLQKPVILSEFCTSWKAGPYPQMLAEHHIAAWAAWVSGLACSPHNWWHEWADQGEHWHPYRAVANYIKGEDIRGLNGRCVRFEINHPKDARMWSRAWFQPGIIYGYILDWQWGYEGLLHPLHQGVSLTVGSTVKSGELDLEWWDANLGTIIEKKKIMHKKGPLIIQCPDFRRHIAFKLRRLTTVNE